MKLTERLIYLCLMLGMVLFGVERINWFSGHYDQLNKDFDILSRICHESRIKVDVCDLDNKGNCKK